MSKYLPISENKRKQISELLKRGYSPKHIASVTEVSYKTVLNIKKPKEKKILYVFKRKVTKKPKSINRPVSKQKLLKEYIENTDIVWKDDMYKIGVAYITTSLARYSRYNNVKFVKIDEKSWEVIR